MSGLEGLAAELEGLRQAGLYRQTEERAATGGVFTSGNKKVINLSSNDYLDLANHPEVIERASEYAAEFGAGATASRLVAGTLPCHRELEERLAGLKNFPAALLFGSGYLANTGLLSALVGKDDYVLADRLIHASLIDGLLQSQTCFRRIRHNDLAQLEKRLEEAPPEARVLVLTESVFSMNGDLAPLEDMAELTGNYGAALIVDEAHATGVFGENGSGLINERGLAGEVAAAVVTLSKGLGGYGAAVAADSELCELLVNKARPFIYSTALPPASVGAALAALELLEEQPERGTAVLERAAFFREKLQQAGLNTGESASQIVPLIVGDNEQALRLASELSDEGILAVAIRPPTVPRGQARIRFSITYAHDREVLVWVAEKVIAHAQDLGLV